MTDTLTDYMEVERKRTLAIEKIKWTIDNFDLSWGEFTKLNPSCDENNAEKREHFMNAVEHHFNTKPTPEYLVLVFNAMRRSDDDFSFTYICDFIWHRAIYKEMLVIERVKL